MFDSDDGGRRYYAPTRPHFRRVDTGRERRRPFVPHSRDPSGWALPGGLAFSADGGTLVSRGGPDVLVWDARALP